MSISNTNEKSNTYKIIAVDDENGILDSLSVFLKDSGYDFTGCTDPVQAIELVKNEHFDIMILDYILSPIRGDQVVEEIRKFDKELYILFLTGHTSYAPPLETIRRLSIQGYCEKSSQFDQLLLLIESAVKSIEQMNTIRQINRELQASKENLEKAYLDSIQTLRYTVEAKDAYTRGHSDRVAKFSVLIGKHMDLPDSDLKTLYLGGLFHDIGKIGIPDSILLKQGKLTGEEYVQIQAHTSIGKNILSNASIFENIIPIVYHHHEKYDGTGYPEHLKGDQIPLLARIATVADTFDAMTSKRSYRDEISLEIVRSEIEKCSGTQFDPEITKFFLDILDNHYYHILEIQNKYK